MKSNKSIVIDFFEEVYNKRNFEYILKFFSETYYEHRIDGARTNKDAYEITKMACGIFPDLRVEIEDVVEENNLIAIRLTFSGTHKGLYINTTATNKFITFEAMEFFEIKNKKIMESWGSWPNHDILELLNTK